MQGKYIPLHNIDYEKDFIKSKLKEYSYHIPTYKYDESLIVVLQLLYNAPTKMPNELISLHSETMQNFTGMTNTQAEKLEIPNFSDSSFYFKYFCERNNPANNINFSSYKKFFPRLHLFNVLLNLGFSYNFTSLKANYCFYAKNLLEIDGGNTADPQNITRRMLMFFSHEIATNNKLGWITAFASHTYSQKSIAQTTLSSLLKSIRSKLDDLSFLGSCILPLWKSDNYPVTKQDNKSKKPNKEYRHELSNIYLYYVILWNYLHNFLWYPHSTLNESLLSDNTKQEHKSVDKEIRQFKHLWFEYQSAIQNCYALYLLEITPEYKNMLESVRTIRYFFANKVFKAALDLLNTDWAVHNQILLIKPYLNTFLNTNYTRPENTAIRKQASQHSPASDYFDKNNFRDRLAGLQSGYVSLGKNQIHIALPIRKGKPSIGCHSLAYLLGISESYDFINDITKNPNITPSNKIPTKLATRWPHSINILSLSFDERYTISQKRVYGENLGFLLYPHELMAFADELSLLKYYGNDIKDLCAKIKNIATQNNEIITALDINYFKLFNKMICEHTYQYYYWFTLPFIHITKLLSKIPDKDLYHKTILNRPNIFCYNKEFLFRSPNHNIFEYLDTAVSAKEKFILPTFKMAHFYQELSQKLNTSSQDIDTVISHLKKS